MKPNKFTFKREPRQTGLAGVGNPYPNVQIKHNKRQVGVIYAPTWQSEDRVWTVSLMKHLASPTSPDEWKWVSLKEKFEDEDCARAYLNKNVERVQAIGLYHEEPDE